MEMELTEMFIEILQAILLVFITVGLPKLLEVVNKYIDAKQKEVITNTYLSEAIDLIQSVTDAITQTYVSELKKNDKFDKAAQEEAMNRACNTAKQMLNTDVAEWINDTYNDAEMWIKAQIEAYLQQNK